MYFASGDGQDVIDNSGWWRKIPAFQWISSTKVASGLMKAVNDLVLNVQMV